MKKWIVKKADDKLVSEITTKTDLSLLCANVFSARGLNSIDEVSSFFTEEDFSDPFLLKDMQTVCEFITEAVESQMLICIYGDYDCDGVTATTVLYTYLDCQGANMMYYIPSRDEGYGLNKNAIDRLYNQGVKLIITVDNGISAIEEAKYIESLSMKLIITDHHQPSEELPVAVGIINPHQKDDNSPYKDLAGVGVVMKLLAGLEGGNYEAITEQFGDLICLGTIADIVPITGENRSIVKKGLRLLENTENQGLSYLIESAKCGQNITSTTVGFMIAPRINAAGRLETADLAVKLLIDDQEPEQYAQKLIALNFKRKETENEIIIKIEQMISNKPEILNERVIILEGEGWHHGIIGIVCSKILEKFGKPVFIISIEGDEARGSARSIKGFNIFKALSSVKDVLAQFGGHELAGGFSLKTENIPKFKEMLYQYAKENNSNMPVMTYVADKVLTSDDLDVSAIESLSVLEPFGQGNSQPMFLVIGAKIEKIIPLSNGKHTRLEILYQGKLLTALLFGVSPQDVTVKEGSYGDFLVYAEINDYMGKRSVILKVKDYRGSGISQEKYFSAKACYENIKRDEILDRKIIEKIIPSRDELINIYKYVSQIKNEMSSDCVFSNVTNEKMNYCKFRLCIDIFEECGFIKYDCLMDTIIFIPPTKKVDIEDSHILKKLRCL